jgi:anti-anti-sigma factor
MKLTLLPPRQDAVVRIRCEGDITRHEVADPLPDLLGPYGYSETVLLYLERARFIHTSGISWLVDNHKRFQAYGGRLVLCGVPPVILDMLDFVCLTTLLNIVPPERRAA